MVLSFIMALWHVQKAGIMKCVARVMTLMLSNLVLVDSFRFSDCIRHYRKIL